jgi:hypothetical protein
LRQLGDRTFYRRKTKVDPSNESDLGSSSVFLL